MILRHCLIAIMISLNHNFKALLVLMLSINNNFKILLVYTHTHTHTHIHTHTHTHTHTYIYIYIEYIHIYVLSIDHILRHCLHTSIYICNWRATSYKNICIIT